VYDTDTDGESRFIVMELVDGPTLAEVIAERGPMEPRVAVEIAAAAARALAAAHRRGLIHRDVKPANLLIGRDGRVRLADSGIARALTASRTTTPGTVLGSIPYLSPEQARGDDATAAGDIFSLGVVLYEMLTGQLPWDADTPAAMATVRLHVPAPAPSIIAGKLPAGLDAIVAKALALDADQRYPSARVFADALEAWNRRHRGSTRASIVSATTKLATQVAAARAPRLEPLRAGATPSKEARAGTRRANANTAAATGTAGPNPWASSPGGRGRTRRGPLPGGHGLSPAAAAVPAGGGAPPADALPPRIAADDGRERRGRLLGAALLLLSLILVVATRLALLMSPGGAPQQTAVPGAVVLPTASSAPSFAPLPAIPSPSPSPSLTPSRTPHPTARPAPIETPRNTVRGPAATVRAFYRAVVAHDWDTAIAIWSPSMQRRYPPQQWLINRFKPTTRIDITRLRTVALNEAAGTARVDVRLVEYRSSGPSPRVFDGAWDLVRINGRWRLNDPDF
jgi:serine/threonine-protein kinase